MISWHSVLKHLACIAATSMLAALPAPAFAQSETPGSGLQGLKVCGHNRRPVEVDDAIRGCSKLIETGSATPKTIANYYATRGAAFRFAGHLQAAFDDFNSALALVPSHYDALFGRAMVYGDYGDQSAALTDYNTLIGYYPNTEFPYHNRGNIYIEQKRYDLALADFNRMIAINPQSYEGYNARAWLHLLQKQYREALADCDASLLAKPDYDAAFDTRGLAHLLLQEYTAAIADFDATLRISPEIAATLYARGVAKNLQQRNASSGASDIAAARAIDPGIVKQFADFALPVY